jgi:hypothetical protein
MDSIATCLVLPGRLQKVELSEKVLSNIKHIQERLIQIFPLALALRALNLSGQGNLEVELLKYFY